LRFLNRLLNLPVKGYRNWVIKISRLNVEMAIKVGQNMHHLME